jgi:Tfp pilus assembly protein PilF
LAISYVETRNFHRAEEVLRSALAHDPENARLLTELARAQHYLGDNDAAERSARDVLALTPDCHTSGA